MPFTVRTAPKIKEVSKIKDVLLKEKPIIKEKTLYFAAGAGGIPPTDDGSKIFKNLTPEQITRIMEKVGDSNKILVNKNFYNKSVLK